MKNLKRMVLTLLMAFAIILPSIVFAETVEVKTGEELKAVLATGGEAKFYLLNNVIYVDNIVDNRRGRKLYPGTILKCSNEEYEIVKDDNQES